MRYLFLVLLPILARSASSQIDVPGDYPDPQTAVDHANPGDVIVVHGGTWTAAGLTPALVIDKPLTLIGDPVANFEPRLNGGVGYQPPTILLSGPGSGAVVLARIYVGGSTNGISWWGQSGGVTGGGFAEVHIYDSTITAPAWGALSGIVDGSSAIDVATPFLLLSHATVHASDGGADDCYGVAHDGRAGVRCTGTVVALDSTIVGGSHIQPCFSSAGCGTISGGNGGPGVESARLDEAGSSISGGPGAVWKDYFGAPCGSSANGPAVVATTHVTLANDLVASSPASLGGSVTLAWNTAGPTIQIYYSRAPAAPHTIVPGFPEAYFDASRAHFLGSFAAGGGVQSIHIPVPPVLALLGLEFTFQGFNPPSTATRPASIVLGL